MKTLLPVMAMVAVALGCGNEMKKVDLAGSGIYYCNCGGSCKCNYVSPEPGTCRCGMELKST